MVFMGVLHCNLRAKNVFVDLNEHEKPFRMVSAILQAAEPITS